MGEVVGQCFGYGDCAGSPWSQVVRGAFLDEVECPEDGEGEAFASAEGTAKGGYVLADAPEGTSLDVVLIGTGSEVQLAVEAREQLKEKGIGARVVSMPCREWFDAQDQDYRESVIPRELTARVSVDECRTSKNGSHLTLSHVAASAAYRGSSVVAIGCRGKSESTR